MVCYAAIPNWYRDQGVSWESKCILKLRALTCCKWWVTLYYCRVIFHCRYTTSTLAIHLLVDTISFDELTRADSNMTLRGDVSRHCFLWRDGHSNMLKFIFKDTIFREVPFCHFHTQSKQALFLASISALNLQRKKISRFHEPLREIRFMESAEWNLRKTFCLPPRGCLLRANVSSFWRSVVMEALLLFSVCIRDKRLVILRQILS